LRNSPVNLAWQDDGGVELRVDVRFLGFVRDVVGETNLSLEMPPISTVRDVLDRLIERFGEGLRERLLTKNGETETNVQVFVGNDQTTSLEQPIRDGQDSSVEVKVFVLSATAGG
jgi:molybdopterin converting factor small subunit